MVRKTTKRVVENARGGAGTVEFHDILAPEEFNGHGRLYAKTVIKPHSSIGFHVHEADTEPYYILEGHGVFVDNDKSRTEVGPGDVCVIGLDLQRLGRNREADLLLLQEPLYHGVPGVIQGSVCGEQAQGAACGEQNGMVFVTDV